MQNSSVQYTLAIFDRLYADLPPLVPKAIVEDMKHAQEQLRLNFSLKKVDLESTIISFGKKIWPYRKAFDEFVDIYEGKLGETFLVAHLSRPMKKRFQEYKAYGGDFRSLYAGSPATFFTTEERTHLCASLVGMRHHIRQHAKQAVLSNDQVKYEKRIVEFQIILDDIEKRLDTLRAMADDEQEHPELASEIRAQIEAFEHGLCLLGQSHHYDAICQAEEHFHGRKKEKKIRAAHRS